jgi:hypothetical protein
MSTHLAFANFAFKGSTKNSSLKLGSSKVAIDRIATLLDPQQNQKVFLIQIKV